MSETWKEIPGTEYSVSDQGRVASRKFGKWRILRPGHTPDGYLIIRLCDGSGGRRTVTVHPLVAEAFIGPKPTPKHEVNHRNGTRDDPRADNLEWCTRSGNQRHRFDILKHGNARGEACSWAKVTEVEAREILRRYAAGEVQRVIAADYGINQTTVSDIVLGKSWAWLKQEAP